MLNVAVLSPDALGVKVTTKVVLPLGRIKEIGGVVTAKSAALTPENVIAPITKEAVVLVF
jgi:hypothetical protein